MHGSEFSAPDVLLDADVGASLDRARRVYAHNVPVLINGETGTGKGLFARLLHQSSARSAGPLVTIDCSSIPASLIEAELFGYEEGAFTNARRGGARGKIETAHTGTLFLDEIGDMPLDLQTRLLRVLQERTLIRVGGTGAVTVDFGLVVATHRNLGEMVREKLFRQDLYFRLRGLQVRLSPLRDSANIEQLVDHFVQRHCHSGRDLNLANDAMHLLLKHDWPGNVRELEQVIAVAAALADDSGMIVPEHLPDEIRLPQCARSHQLDKKTKTLKDEERDTVMQALADNGGNISAAARRLGIARTTLYRKLRE